MIRRCVFYLETEDLLRHCHKEASRGNYQANGIVNKVLESSFYWPILFKNAKRYVELRDNYQRTGNISRRDKMPQTNIMVCDVFDVWGINFMGLFLVSFRNRYILVAVDYVSK